MGLRLVFLFHGILVGPSAACLLIPSPESSQAKRNFLTLILTTVSHSIC